MDIAVGLSGGVDSSVAALLLKEQGHRVIGITMKLWDGRYKGGSRAACFGAGEEKSIAMAEAFAKAIGIEYHVYDCSNDYDKTVISYFRDTYLSGKTPNPCVRCNALVKFGLLPKLAADSGLSFDKFATGHYARIAHCPNGRLALQRAIDEGKDQSYFLYRLTQEQLKNIIFPMGSLTKAEARDIAKKHGLITADRPDSQDFYSGDVSELIGEPERPGNIVNTEGRILGRHTGFWQYTIGQRKGLGIGGAGEPYYVVDLNACRNEVIVGRHNEAIKQTFEIEDIAYMAASGKEAANRKIPCNVKIRSVGTPKDPALYEDGRCTIPDGIAGVAPGQSAVFYDENGLILLGGIIK